MHLKNHKSIALAFTEYSPAEMLQRAQAFHAEMRQRRTVRDFSPREVSRDVIETCLTTADTAPSGANQQPWRFVVVSDAAVKSRIRNAAEAEEREFYQHRATEAWREALGPLGTDANKPFIDIAPYLIAVF